MALVVVAACTPGEREVGIFDADPPPLDSSVPAVDGASDASTGDTGTSGTVDHDPDGSMDGNGACAWADAKPTRSPPTVWFVVDTSTGTDGTSLTTFHKITKRYIVGTDSVARDRQGAIRFGAVFHGGDPGSATCPDMPTVEPAYDNLAAIEAIYPDSPGPSRTTQAGYAAERVLQWTEQNPPAPGAQVVILAQKMPGLDFKCEKDLLPEDHGGGSRPDSTPEALSALLDLGVRTFVFVGDLSNSDELESLAQVGGTETPIYYHSENDLSRALDAAIDQAVSCRVSLNGEVEDSAQACQGEVRVDGSLLPCDDPDGWRLADERTVELTGEACERIRADPEAQIEARFPCEIFVEVI